jgi:hypothetical protein
LGLREICPFEISDFGTLRLFLTLGLWEICPFEISDLGTLPHYQTLGLWEICQCLKYLKVVEHLYWN